MRRRIVIAGSLGAIIGFAICIVIAIFLPSGGMFEAMQAPNRTHPETMVMGASQSTLSQSTRLYVASDTPSEGTAVRPDSATIRDAIVHDLASKIRNRVYMEERGDTSFLLAANLLAGGGHLVRRSRSDIIDLLGSPTKAQDDRVVYFCSAGGLMGYSLILDISFDNGIVARVDTGIAPS